MGQLLKEIKLCWENIKEIIILTCMTFFLLSLSQTNQSLFYLKILLFKSLKPQTVFSQSTTKNEMKIVTPHYVCSWIKLTNPFQKTLAGIYSISFLFYLLEKKLQNCKKKKNVFF